MPIKNSIFLGSTAVFLRTSIIFGKKMGEWGEVEKPQIHPPEKCNSGRESVKNAHLLKGGERGGMKRKYKKNVKIKQKKAGQGVKKSEKGGNAFGSSI